MNKIWHFSYVLGLGCALSFLAPEASAAKNQGQGQGADGKGKGRGMTVEAMDTDGDGQVSLDEFEAKREKGLRKQFEKQGGEGTFEEFAEGKQKGLEKHFNRTDTDEDGYLSAAELEEGAKKMKHGKGRGKGGKKQGQNAAAE